MKNLTLEFSLYNKNSPINQQPLLPLTYDFTVEREGDVIKLVLDNEGKVLDALGSCGRTIFELTRDEYARFLKTRLFTIKKGQK